MADILVAVDSQGLGNGASWTVAGHPEVIEPYLAALEAGVADRSILYDLSIERRPVGHCCLH